MNGIDHAEAQTETPAVIAYANNVLPDVQIEHGTLPEYVDRGAGRRRLTFPSFSGEFNSGRYSVILQGVYSTRMYLKQANERVQTLLERYAEPLAAWAWTLGGEYPCRLPRPRLAPPHAKPPARRHLRVQRGRRAPREHDPLQRCRADRPRSSPATASGAMAGHIDRAAAGRALRGLQPAGVALLGHRRDVSLLFDRVDTTARQLPPGGRSGQPVPCQVLGDAATTSTWKC